MSLLSGLPHNQEAEQGLLGHLMMDNRGMERIGDLITAADFSHPIHAEIFETIRKLIDMGMEAKPTTIVPYFQGRTVEEEGINSYPVKDYIVELGTEFVMLNSAYDYARMIKSMSFRRVVMQTGIDMVEQAKKQDIDVPPHQIIELAEAKLFSIADRAGVTGEAIAIGDVLGQSIALVEKAFKGEIVGVPTGIKCLDDYLGLLPPSEVTVVAGRPGMGKTVLGLTAAVGAARAGHKTLFFSLEMDPPQLGARLLARKTNISIGFQRHPAKMNADGWLALQQAQNEYSKLPLAIDESPDLTVGQIATRARRHKRKHGLDLIVIDYLQLIRATDPKAQKVHQIEEITRRLKVLAKELKIHVMVLCQLNRSVESRDDKRPSMSDLRDSGAIEQDADMIIFPYRREYYLAKEEPVRKTGETHDKFNERYQAWEEVLEESKGKVDLIIGKFRQGSPGVVHARFDGVRQYFYDEQDVNP